MFRNDLGMNSTGIVAKDTIVLNYGDSLPDVGTWL
jgi:hypothetical protein